MPRNHPLHAPPGQVVITFDASLQGGGAFVERPEADVTEYVAVQWTASEAKMLGASRAWAGDQPVWEAYMLLVAISTWLEVIVGAGVRLHFRGDAQGVLQGVIARRAKQPVLNAIIGEIQLLLGRSTHDLQATHIWAERNEMADALSRLGQGAALPQFLRESGRAVPAVRREWRLLGSMPA